MVKIYILYTLLFLVGFDAMAQPDSSRSAKTLYDAFRKGYVHGNFRSVYQSTINTGALTDYYAAAAGGLLKYETAQYHKFSIGLGGSFTYNLTSSDLGKPDSATGVRNRYEILLMDIQNPYNRNNMFRLDWLCIKYRFGNSYLVLGKQYILTPFINQQDLFMRGSVVDGLYGNIQLHKKLKLEIAYIYGISANATTRWFKVGESIGIFPKGVNPDGSASGYSNNVHSDGLGLVGIQYMPAKKLKLQLWNQYVDQVFNTALLQADYTMYLTTKKNFLVALQVIRQDPLASGGNTDHNKTYYSINNQSVVFGARVAYHTPAFDMSANYTRVTAHGRYQMPREWGREPMFTFLMREQIEGSGDVHAVTTKATYTFKKVRLKADAGIGYYDMPDVLNARLSKYGMPSFIQYCATLRHSFKGKLKGFDAELLYMYKQKTGEHYGIDKYVINRVDMSQFCFNLLFSF